ncbi:hypothetical protein LTR96_012015, partial [Exophiala xenobiotica]
MIKEVKGRYRDLPYMLWGRASRRQPDGSNLDGSGREVDAECDSGQDSHQVCTEDPQIEIEGQTTNWGQVTRE